MSWGFQHDKPCPACGAPVAYELLEVTSWSDPPGTRRTMRGRMFCENDCDPRYRRVVVARSYREFEVWCHSNRMNPRVVRYVGADDDIGTVQHRLMGTTVPQHMLTIASPPRREVWHFLQSLLQRGSGLWYEAFPLEPASDSIEMINPGFPRVDVEEMRQEMDRAVLAYRDQEVAADHRLIREGDVISVEYFDERISREERFLDDHTYRWDDAMAWCPPDDDEQPRYI